MDVDTRLLRYFVAVAEELSFTRAAERLFVSQPALSKQIRQLENELRTPVFVRTKRDVSLTPAGHALLPVARKVLDVWQAGLRDTRTAASTAARVVRVGFQATAAGPLTTAARTEFARLQPGVVVEPKRFDWGGEADALRDGLADVAFVWLPADTSGLDLEVVRVEQRMVGMAAAHHLANQETVSIMDLLTEPIMWTPLAPRPWVDWWAVNPRPDGSEPVWGPQNANVEEMLENVASGLGICISPQSMAAYYGRPDLVWRPIPDIEPLRIALAWPETSSSQLVAAYVEVVRTLAEGMSADGDEAQPVR
ncbi:LysR family transcriptional regulator [Kribbella sp. NPDC023855]|uniref:LysR family transcriptional regulator n=1 Tax=Kribbella sp. NPDC023855 TaxID=3154698 RepID=UPI0033D8FEAB